MTRCHFVHLPQESTELLHGALDPDSGFSNEIAALSIKKIFLPRKRPEYIHHCVWIFALGLFIWFFPPLGCQGIYLITFSF